MAWGHVTRDAASLPPLKGGVIPDRGDEREY